MSRKNRARLARAFQNRKSSDWLSISKFRYESESREKFTGVKAEHSTHAFSRAPDFRASFASGVEKKCSRDEPMRDGFVTCETPGHRSSPRPRAVSPCSSSRRAASPVVRALAMMNTLASVLHGFKRLRVSVSIPLAASLTSRRSTPETWEPSRSGRRWA